MDLFLEHRNNAVKACTDLLGSNFSEESAQRIARSNEVNEVVLSSINDDCKRAKGDSKRSKTDPTETVQQLVSDLLSPDAFVFIPGREGYPSFPRISVNLIDGRDYRDLYKWIRSRLDEWAKIYEH